MAASVPKLVAARAADQPDAVAILDHDGRQLSYGELLRRADGVAGWLRERATAVEDRVGVRCGRSIEYVVAVLGVMRARAAYVPVDPAYPVPRQEYLLADAGVRTVLGHAAVAGLAGHPPLVDAPPPGLDSLAYVVYTSGTGGQPKGVAVEHRALANLVAWHRNAFGPQPGDRICLCAGVSFDAAVWDLWPNLVAGATLVLASEADRRDPHRLRDLVVAQGVTAMFAPTALAQALGALDWPATTRLRLVLTGGEALPARPRAGLPYRLVNNYGPTEATVVATSGTVEPGEGVPTIGRAIDGVTLHVLDPDGRPAPAGELYLGGAGLARGYLSRPDLTAQRFLDDPGRGRLYRTGDLVRQRDDGELEYLGRVDDQVQVRGHRVEPTEVEAALCAHPDVEAACVVERTEPTGAALVGFYVAPAPVDDLRAWLAGRVPAPLVPGSLRWREALPLTGNGKVDRLALRAAAQEGPDERDVAPPRTATEAAVAEVWAEVFGFPVGVDEPYEELGGHSLHAVRLATLIRDRWGVEVPLELLYGPVTIAGLAAALDAPDRPRSWAPDRESISAGDP